MSIPAAAMCAAAAASRSAGLPRSMFLTQRTPIGNLEMLEKDGPGRESDPVNRAMRPRFDDRGQAVRIERSIAGKSLAEQFANDLAVAAPRTPSARSGMRGARRPMRRHGPHEAVPGSLHGPSGGLPIDPSIDSKDRSDRIGLSDRPETKREHVLRSFQLQFVVHLFGVAELSKEVANRIPVGQADQIAAAMGHQRADQPRMRLPVGRLPIPHVGIQIAQDRPGPWESTRAPGWRRRRGS